MAAGGVQLHHVPSDDFSVLKEPAVKVLGEKLRQCLDDAPAPENADLEVAVV
jgi:hypothetical protein